MEYLITFSSTSHAIRAESHLLKKNVLIKVRPIPSKISSGCGICLVFDDIDTVLMIVKEDSLAYDKIYMVNDNNYVEYK